MTAVKNTVAPMPAYLFCSPLEQEFTMWVSTPEHRRKKRFNMMIDLSPKRVRMIVMIDDYTNITPKAWVYCKVLIFNKKTRLRLRAGFD